MKWTGRNRAHRPPRERTPCTKCRVAFFWHQHQPYYPDDVAGENPMPWVRLHGTKDYWGMAMLLKEVPEMHATINLVPSLLVQLTAYTEHGAQDDAPARLALPADGLSEDDRLLPARQLLHGPPGPDDPALSALPRAVPEAGPGRRHGRAGRASVSDPRHSRPAMLVEPDLDSPAGLRAGPGAGRVPQQGAALDRGGKAVAAGQADGAAWPRSCRCTASWPSAGRSS